MKIHPFQAIYPNLTLVTSPDSFFGSMKHNYPDFVKSGFFQKSAQDAIYIYQIESEGHSYLAVIAANDIQDVEDQKILKHEETLSTKEQSMMQLILQRNAIIKPVLLAYEGNNDINLFISEEMDSLRALFKLDFEETQESHTLYAITDRKKIAKLQILFKEKVKKCFIADGHHRVSTASILHKCNHLRKDQLNRLLSVYFPFDELDIYDYNRSIKLQEDLTEAQIVARLSKVFKISELDTAAKPKKKHHITMHLGKIWYLLKWKNKIIEKYNSDGLVLDSDLLNRYVLDDILDVDDIGTDLRVKYIAGTLRTDGVEKLALKDHGRIGFCLYAVTKQELKYIAENGLHLPPKSTWFEPRIKNGVIVQEL